MVDPGEFRTPAENNRLSQPLAGRGFQVWGLKDRAARDGEMRYNWRLGVRLGPNASELFSQMVSDLGGAPPGIRKAGFREVVEVLRSPGQVGCPPGIATDAQLGFSGTAYQFLEVLFDRCGGDGHFLVRLTGACARTRQGGQGELTQRAKDGYCPCRTRPIHEAAPSRYTAGEFSGHKANGIQLRRDFGPWAVRFFAAVVCARGNDCLSSAWDWAAQSLALKPPAVFDSFFGAERAEHHTAPAPSSQNDPPGTSKPTVRPPADVPPYAG